MNFNFIAEPGLINLLLLITVLIAVLFNRERTTETEVFAFTPQARPIPERLQSYRWARNVNKSGIILLAVIAIALPLIFTTPSTNQIFTEVLAFAICATSLTVLTGWLGQLSLGQMAFAGLGALFAARLVEAGVPFWLAIAATTVASAMIATVLGLGSLRVRGLYLAVVTFTFALAAQQYFFSLPVLSGQSSDGSDLPFPPGKLFSLSFPGQRTYYYVVLVILGVVLLVTSRFRDSGVGRSIMAVRDNETAAAAYTVRPAWEKIRAFAIAGALAGLGGALLSGAFANVAFSGPGSPFIVDGSLALVAMVVIGGMGSVTAAVIGAVWVIGIPALAPEQRRARAPGVESGAAGHPALFPPWAQSGQLRRARCVLGMGRPSLRQGARRHDQRVSRPRRSGRRRNIAAGVPSLAVSELRVVFGGITAVSDVSLVGGERPDRRADREQRCRQVDADERRSVASSLPRAPCASVTKRSGTEPPSSRAALGLGRTFQSATLFPELTVTETLLVAHEARGRTGALSTALALPPARRRSRRDRSDVADLVELLGLTQWRDHHIGDLSTGTRRVVELAGLLALDAKVLCLDEPTAGLAQRETEAFGPLIVSVQRELERVGSADRARHAPHHEHQQPRLLPRSGVRHRRGLADGCPREPPRDRQLPGDGRANDRPQRHDATCGPSGQ